MGQHSNFQFAPDGTALAPALAWSSETSLGLYRSANSVIATSFGTFSTAGLLATTIGAQSGNTISISSAILVQPPGSANGLAIRQAGGANMEIRQITAGQLEIAQTGTGTMVLASGSGGMFIQSPEFSTRMIVRSGGSIDLNQSPLVSMRTTASLDSLNLATNEVAFSLAPGSSGASLAIRSGGTIYYFSSSNSTKG